ncbi:MAG: replicative DNA helicase [Verrucomicrobiota bacterium]
MIAPAHGKSDAPARQASATEILTQPLYSAEAEKAVLGSMMVRPEIVVDEVVETLNEKSFFVPAHQLVFAAVSTMHANGMAIDMTTIHQYLSDKKQLEAVGGLGYLAEIINGFTTHLNVGSYVEIVKGKSLLRHLQDACANIAQEISDQQDSVPKILDRAEKEIFEVTNLGLTNTTSTARDEIDKAIALIENFTKRKGQMFGIPTGFQRLNDLTTGWQKGDMIVLAARPGVGKTALALTFAKNAMDSRYDQELDNWVKPGYGVGMFSLEMTNEQLMLRLIASYASESLQRIRSGELDDHALEKIKMIGEDMKDYPLVLDDSSFLTINQLRGKARRMKKNYNIDLLMIDYLQLLKSDSDQAKDNRQNEVAEISRGIKALAKELEIPIIVLAQLNRKSEEGKSEPALHNLRESGAIEQDADMVMLLHRPDPEPDAEPSWTIPYQLIIAKQRNGPTDKLDLQFQAQYTRFDDPVKHEVR